MQIGIFNQTWGVSNFVEITNEKFEDILLKKVLIY